MSFYATEETGFGPCDEQPFDAHCEECGAVCLVEYALCAQCHDALNGRLPGDSRDEADAMAEVQIEHQRMYS